jgi:hypothetical protein
MDGWMEKKKQSHLKYMAYNNYTKATGTWKQVMEEEGNIQ